MKRWQIAAAVLLLLGNLVVFEWVAALVFTGQLEPSIDPSELEQPQPTQQ